MSPEATVVDQTLRSDLSRPFLPQPPNHSGDVRTKMYQVTITQEQGHLLLEVIKHAARQKVIHSGHPVSRPWWFCRGLRRIDTVAG